MFGTPAAEAHIDAELVGSLIRDQFPQHAERRLRPIGSGWDNVMMRLGDDLLVRLPRRAVAVPLIEHEQRWLPMLARKLPIPVPAPIRVGRPGEGYPWPWSIAPWLPGKSADLEPPHPDEATRLAAFLAALHQPAPPAAPVNPVRGVPLSSRADATGERMQRLTTRTDLITARVAEVWLAALTAPMPDTPRWLHGDLHPRNILVERGRISGIIDWGDINGGDVATDLAALWMLFEKHPRQAALNAYGEIDDATLTRAKGWAAHFGVVLLDAGLVDDPAHAAVGAATLRRLAADD